MMKLRIEGLVQNRDDNKCIKGAAMGLLINLDLPSLSIITHNASQVMVYGFGHCKYLQIIHTLQNTPSSIDTVFECSIGNSYNFPNYTLEDKYRTTREGRLMRQFQPEPLDEIQDEKFQTEKFCTRVCKAGTIALVYENFLRKKKDYLLFHLYLCLISLTILIHITRRIMHRVIQYTIV